MPNISFDIFYDKDILNFTATRGKQVPKIKPAWKTRTAPKLAPKEPDAPSFATPLSKNRVETLPSTPTASKDGKLDADKASAALNQAKKTNAGIKAPKLNAKPKA